VPLRLSALGLAAICVIALHADTPVINDTATQYTISQIYPPFPACGTCDLSPSYNPYGASSAFTITKVTFSWYNNGTGNTCDSSGTYVAAIATATNPGAIIATSANSIYLGCSTGGAPATGVGELDFAGQPIPGSFYLDFYSLNGLENGASIGIYNVAIWQLGPADIFGSQLDSTSTITDNTTQTVYFNLGQSTGTSTQIDIGIWIATYRANCFHVALQQADDAAFTQNLMTVASPTVLDPTGTPVSTYCDLGSGKFVYEAQGVGWIAGKYYRLSTETGNGGDSIQFYSNSGGAIWFVMADNLLSALEPPILASTPCPPSQTANGSGLVGGGAERIYFSLPVTLDSISLWAQASPPGAYCCSQSFATIYADDAGTMGGVLATTNPVTLSNLYGTTPPQEATYTFGNPITLLTGTYWLGLTQGPGNGTIIFGSSGADLFAGGYWAYGSLSQDAYFQLGGTCGSSTGTIQVSTTPTNAPFSIIGLAAYSSGTSTTFTNAPVGSYTIIFGPVPGYLTPTPQTQTLSVGGTISFVGTYNPLPSLVVSPGALSFSYQQGAPGPIPPQTLSVATTGAALSFTASLSTTPPGGTWLSMVPTTDTTPSTISVSVAAGLVQGTYNGQITIAALGAPNSPQTVPVTLIVAPSRAITLANITGWNAPASGEEVLNAQWTGQPIPPAPNHGKYYLFYAIDACQHSSPCSAICESPQQEGCTGIPGQQVVAVDKPLWHLLGSGFCPPAGCAGTKGSVAFSDSAISTVPASAILNWNNAGTEITFVPSFVSPSFQYPVNTNVSVTITTPDGLTATLPLPTPGGSPATPGAISTIDGRGYGQCTWYVANQRLAQGLPIPVPAYYHPSSNGGSIDATYVPQQWDVLDFTDLHTAIIKSPVIPTPVRNPDGSITTTYGFTIGEMNVGTCNKNGVCKPSEWSEEPSTMQSTFVVNMSASGVLIIQTEIYSYFCPNTTPKCISDNRYATYYFR